ncbi:MAG: hypothetical protein AB7O67_23285 [Vicinamibacterales bacterium]
MELQTLPNLERARRAGQVAAERAGQHAEDARRGWLDRAAALVTTFAQAHGLFLLEDARLFAERQGLPAPPDKRAWGAVVQMLARRRVLVRDGYAPAASSHGSPKCLWRASR